MTDKSLLQDFITETGEHLEETEHNLMRLEQQPDDADLLNNIFRSVHTIKGSSEYLGMARIAELSHKLENLLDMLRRGELGVDADVISLLIGTNDRLGALVDELDQHQEEKSSIDDLLAVIEQQVNRAGQDQETAGGEVIDAQDDDEYDEELFNIFAEQLKEGLQGLSDDAAELQTGDAAEVVLERCVERLATLRSSANYMGYDELKGMYGQWISATEAVNGQLSAGDEADLDAFAKEIQTHIGQVKALFPQMFPPDQEDVASEELKPPEQPEQSEQTESEVPRADIGLLQDFITETGEHLEETEHNLMRLEQQPDDADLLNNIFRSVHTIKGSSEYLGMARIAELSHKLENLLDMLRRGELGVDADVISLLIGTNDRLGALVDELDQHQEEKSSIDDLLAVIEQQVNRAGQDQETAGGEVIDAQDDDEYDEELFNIFAEQLKEGLQGLSDDAAELQTGDAAEVVLERCVERLATLRSSANYMGYDELKGMYGQWISATEAVNGQLSAGDEADLDAFAKEIQTHIGQVKALFPQMFPPDQEDAASEEQEESTELAPSADPSLLEDFIAETGEHLEETEHNLMRLEQQPDDADVLNDIFRSIHTIKGSSEYLGMGRIAELSHKLENLLDMLRHGELTIDANVIELLIAASDRIGSLMDDIEKDSTEQAPVDDLIDRIDACVETKSAAPPMDEAPIESNVYTNAQGVPFEEVFDQELFGIFMGQLNAGIQALSHEAEQLRSSTTPESILTRCVDQITTLRSSANYMDYDDLKTVYEKWLDAIETIQGRMGKAQEVDLNQFIDDVMAPNMARVKAFFTGLPAADETAQKSDNAASIKQPAVKREEIAPKAEPVQRAAPIETMVMDKDEDFKVISLADLEDDPVIEVVGSISGGPEGPDDALLNQLESAFEANIGDFAKKENGSLPKEMEETLLSGEQPLAQMSSSSVPTHDIMDEYAEEEAGDKDVKTMVFSGSDAGQPTMPKDTQEKSPVALSESIDTPERGRGYKVGRRQSDKFRERMVKQSIRVDASKIDVLMNQVGELVVSRSGFMQLINDLREMQFFLKQSQKLDSKEMQWVKDITNRISDATSSFGRVTSELQENVMKVRMLPIAQLFSRYPRLVHDLVKGTQKKVSLEIRGEETELDKMVIEQIADPLVHIIRNAVDHGIEDAAERKRKGKPEEGVLRLDAYHESNYVVIEINDDGRGMEAAKIKASAIENGFATEQEVEGMGEQELLTLIMRPGFSTAKKITHTSGRGVGMDVVKDNIEKLNGTIDIASTIGSGVTIRIKIPLTLAIIPALLVRVVDELFTIPLPSVDETLRVKHSEISTLEGLEVYYVRDVPIPLIRLSKVFKMDTTTTDSDDLFVVIVNTGTKQIGLVVDELKARQEVVIKPLEDYLQEKSGFSGATILGDGSISLIISVPELVQLALGRHAEQINLATA